MEEAFDLIEQGNQACDEKNYWKASHCFGQASRLLHSFSSSSTSSNATQEIAELCLTQSKEYKQKARECFVQALQHQQHHELKPNWIDKDANQYRLELFAHLYSDPKLLNNRKKDTLSAVSSNTTLDDLSLRLQALHEFQIPKQSLSKMEELNAGLRRLGLQPVTEAAGKKQLTAVSWGIESSQSPEEQVNALLQQVQEQVQVIDSEDAMNLENHNSILENGDDDEDDSTDEQMQVNRLLQQLQDEQALEETIRDEELHTRPHIPQTESTISLLSPETADQVMKDTLEAELLLTQVIGLLEKEESSSNTPTIHRVDGAVIQALIRQARSTLNRAEEHIAKK